MTREEILEGNKLCAEFLEYVNTTPTDKDFSIYHNEKGMIIGNKIYTMLETMSMKFHSDWNWLMNVVDKIESLGYGYYPKPIMLQGSSPIMQNVQIGLDVVGYISIERLGDTKLEATFKAVIEFIKWYNQNSK